MTASEFRFAVVGDGAWGTALARRMVANGASGCLVGPGLRAGRLPKGLRHSVELPEILQTCEAVLIAVPIGSLEGVLRAAAPHLEGHHRVATTARGLAPGPVPQRASELLQSLTCVRQTAVLAGAADAEALEKGHPAALVVASAFPSFAQELQAALAGETLRVYTNGDLTGVELANTLAAVMAVGLGVARALGVGAATEATALTRALAEMDRLVVALGGRAGTAYGLAGLGVLSELVFDGTGRAFAAGAALARGDALARGEAAELSEASASLSARAAAAAVRAPMVDAVHAMFTGCLSAGDALSGLMKRSARSE